MSTSNLLFSTLLVQILTLVHARSTKHYVMQLASQERGPSKDVFSLEMNPFQAISFPTISPSHEPSDQPSLSPTTNPTTHPSSKPSPEPSYSPTKIPSIDLSGGPTSKPTKFQSKPPSSEPRQSKNPSLKPFQPSLSPTTNPTTYPSSEPSPEPSYSPTKIPSTGPTSKPTKFQSEIPSSDPTQSITSLGHPNNEQSLIPSSNPSMEIFAEGNRGGRGYFNYNPHDLQFGPDQWMKVENGQEGEHWKKFDDILGDNSDENECDWDGRQSPIDVCPDKVNYGCEGLFENQFIYLKVKFSLLHSNVLT